MTSKLFTANNSNWTELRDLLAANKEWHNSSKSFRGVKVEYPLGMHTGIMSTDDVDRMREINSHNSIDYMVYSYSTPIAYRSGGKWYWPDANYTKTTAKHKGRLLPALVELNERATNAGSQA